MTWFKVDDSFYDHPKVFDAPDCAVALWTRAGTWSARNLTDGFVPAGMPARLCDDPDTAVKELVRRGLWSRVKDGFRFHDWSEYQPSRESVERDRAAAAERQRRRRAQQKGQVKGSSVTPLSRRDTPVTGGVTHAVSSPAPTRPDPLPSGERVGGARHASRGAARAPSTATHPPSSTSTGDDPGNPDWRTMPAYGQAEPRPETPAQLAARQAAAAARPRRADPDGPSALERLLALPDPRETP